jgi:hypothetical protein
VKFKVAFPPIVRIRKTKTKDFIEEKCLEIIGKFKECCEKLEKSPACAGKKIMG